MTDFYKCPQCGIVTSEEPSGLTPTDEGQAGPVQAQYDAASERVAMTYADEPTTPVGERFKRGDRVRVVFESAEEGRSWMDCIYVSGPAGPGDTIKLMDEDGQPVEVNGNGPTFEVIHAIPGDLPTDTGSTP